MWTNSQHIDLSKAVVKKHWGKASFKNPIVNMLFSKIYKILMERAVRKSVFVIVVNCPLFKPQSLPWITTAV